MKERLVLAMWMTASFASFAGLAAGVTIPICIATGASPFTQPDSMWVRVLWIAATLPIIFVGYLCVVKCLGSAMDIAWRMGERSAEKDAKH